MTQPEAEILAGYRRRFANGPVGVWITALGAGWDIAYGFQFEFRPDFTGRMYAYDTGDEVEPESEQLFTWRFVEPGVIEVSPIGEATCEEDWGMVRYDFCFALSKYGGERRVSLFSPDAEGASGDHDQPGFWWSPLPVVLTEDL